MRIGIDCRMYSSQFTGIGRYVYELTENLLKIDQKNHYVLFFNEPEFSKFIQLHNANKNVTPVLANAKHYSFAEQTKFLLNLNHQNLDLMHFTHFNAPIFYNKKSIVTIHDLTLSFFPGGKMNSKFHRFVYGLTLKTAVKKAKKIITVSNNTKKDLQNLFQTPTGKIATIYLGIDKKFHQLENIQKQNYLLYTGVWRTHKNLTNLIKSFSILKKDYQYDGKLIITGRKDPVYANEIFQLTANLNLTDEIIFTGLVEDEKLIKLYNEASVYVFPSFYEGFGLPPLEAMQCGIPTVVSNTSSIPEICGKENTIYFDPKNPQDMAEKIYQVISEKSLREKLIKNGLQHVKNFSWEKMAEQTLNLYNNV